MPATREKPAKIDLSNELKELYSPTSRAASLVEVPELLFTSGDGVVEAGVPPGESEHSGMTLGPALTDSRRSSDIR